MGPKKYQAKTVVKNREKAEKEPDDVPHIEDKPCPSDPLFDFEFSQDDVATVMSRLKSGKAVGPDGIHPHVLKEVLSLVNPCICYLETPWILAPSPKIGKEPTYALFTRKVLASPRTITDQYH